MGLFDRLRSLVSSNVHAALDTAEDPSRTVAMAIEELDRDVRAAREDLVKTLASAKRLEAKAVELDAEASTWEDRAAAAVRAGDDALAREGLSRKLSSQKRADETRGLAARERAEEQRMRDLLTRAEERLRELEARKTSLTSDLRRARSVGSSAPDGASSRLERSLERVDAFDAELEAHAVLVDPKRAEVEAELRKLEKGAEGSRVDDELAALKRKLGG